MAGESVLVVDDEEHIVQLARLYLEQEGYRVVSANDGKAALDAVERERPALVVLDVMLPKLSGLEVCRQLRAEKNPVAILMLTARDEDIDKILGLEMGADDYLTKPFNPRELVVRVKAILRRDEWIASGEGRAMRVGDLSVDPSRHEVRIGGRAVTMRPQEFELLRVLVEHQGHVMSREKLLELAWGYDYYGQTRTVDVHVGQLRKKLADSQVRIETVTNLGYKLVT